MDTIPNPEIPVEQTSFIGRQREVEDVIRLLSSSRLLTITGAPGCGKTRLALHTAHQRELTYPDGIYWIELAPLTDTNQMAQVIGKRLNAAGQTDQPWTEQIVDSIKDKKLLLVLDNCEHLRTACASLVDTLISQTGIQVLATSREGLGIASEMLYPLTPMSIPPASLTIDDIDKFDAVQLFTERACAVLPQFTLTGENIGAVANICRHLDGIPLAIELASSRINVLTVRQIEAGLNDRNKLLAKSSPTDIRHHSTLQAALDWSYDLLSSPEKTIFQRLAVFSGSCSLTSAEEVCSGDGIESEQTLDLLAALISKSLLAAQTLRQGEARYSLLETIRQYAQEKLIANGQSAMIQTRHLDYFLKLTEQTLPKLSGPYQQIWLDELESEYDNIRAALAWSIESNQLEAGLRIAVAIYQFWTIRDYAEEGLSWLDRLLSQATDQVAPVMRANALAYIVFLAGFRGKTGIQLEYGIKAKEFAEILGNSNKPALRWALAAQAYSAQAAGDYQTQLEVNQRVIQLNRELGDLYQLGLILSINSFTAMELEKYEEAHAMLDEALPLLREVGNPYRIAMALNFSGDLGRCEKDFSLAKYYYEECISLLRTLDAPRDLASALQNLGFTCMRLGDLENAHTYFRESMNLQRDQHNKPGIAECLTGFAALAITQGLDAKGAQLLSAAFQISEGRIISTWAATRFEYEYFTAILCSRLTDEQLKAERAVGSALSIEQAVEYALSLPAQGPISKSTGHSTSELTPREVEIARLIAIGRSNGEIAEELIVSKRTIEKHVAHIFEKLGVANRAQIVLWAFDSGLLKTAR